MVTAVASNGAATPFSATYPTGSTTWTCSGAHVKNTGKDYPAGAVSKDSETCLVTGNVTGDGYAAGTYSGAPAGFLAGSPFGANTEWNSDFNGNLATSWTITEIDNGDGTFTVEILAFYAS